MNAIPRQIIQGVQTLLYADGPYIEVAERIRIIHKMSKDFRLHRAETVLVRNRWIYRVTVLLDNHQYIGDAEIHFGASKETPDGTNPIACAQTSAIGNALTFAGFGDLRLLLEWQKLNAEEGKALYSTEEPYGYIEGIRVVWLDETPYVPVAERLYHLHKLGHTLSIDQCEIIRVHGVWVYRVSLCVNERLYIGDAEMRFAAPETSPERRFPVSTAQTSAVGNALALAGFGDVRMLKERMGKEAEEVHWVPSLASADAVSQARQQRQETSVEAGGSEREAAQAMSIHAQITVQQRQTIRDLSSKLGESEPGVTDDWKFDEAETYIEVLYMQVDDLLSTAYEARHAEQNGSGVLPLEEEVPASYTEIGEIKRAWIQAFSIAGPSIGIRRRWEAFKLQHCKEPVNDDIMLQSQYLVLKNVIEQQRAKRAMQQPFGANG